MPKRKTNEEYDRELELKRSGQYQRIENYQGAQKKIAHIHVTCGYEWEVRPNDLLKGFGCPVCARQSIQKSSSKGHKKYLTELKLVLGDEYECLGTYVNNNTKIKHKHITCGYEWDTYPKTLLKEHGCPECSKKDAYKNDENYKKDLKTRHNDEYLSLEPYIDSRTKILHKHVACDYEWEVRPNSILRDRGCPKCKESKGESRVAKYLDENRIEYKRQFKIVECSDIKPLPFDFACFKNGKLTCLIEFDGKQHFQPVKLFGGKEAFEGVKRRDLIKTSYCKNNNIPLIRISYKQLNDVEKILDEFQEVKDNV